MKILVFLSRPADRHILGCWFQDLTTTGVREEVTSKHVHAKEQRPGSSRSLGDSCQNGQGPGPAAGRWGTQQQILYGTCFVPGTVADALRLFVHLTFTRTLHGMRIFISSMGKINK